MGSNQNRYNPQFTTNYELNKEFETKIKSENKFKLIVSSDVNREISVYIQNNTTDTISISHQDYKIYILQEAMDKDGIWKPIEYWKNSDCGNSFGEIKIESYGIIETKSREYNGYFKTKIRFKLSEGNKVYYSNAIEGNIDLDKLITPTDFSFTWPLAFIANRGIKVPMKLQRKVVFLEPNGLKEFNQFIEDILIERN